ncbi:hypothetical protein QC761_0058190 [Podospora bellae-mahoneyi]|uniref:Uncharacterized protein n=1 Tax=Podospora bellae-mahoneyi TaxID=2093777 RepID=A0ABR0FLY8_9PEZI|nr:hypothetical protein QC761_0058190 [Podospora bellae-mahoneyi]
METNTSSDFSSQSSNPILTPRTTSAAHNTGIFGNNDKYESTASAHNNSPPMPTTSPKPEEIQTEPTAARNSDILASAFTSSSFDADSSLHGRFEDAPHQHPNPYSRIGCYTVKAQQLIDNFDQRFDPEPNTIDKPRLIPVNLETASCSLRQLHTEQLP